MAVQDSHQDRMESSNKKCIGKKTYMVEARGICFQLPSNFFMPHLQCGYTRQVFVQCLFKEEKMHQKI